MAYVLQSTTDTSLYFNGSTLNKHDLILSLFDPIANARNFETSAEAYEVAETFSVPVTVVEI